ncbi:MAG: Gfo/Idh/MocA family protein [Anaerolineae bacterium]
MSDKLRMGLIGCGIAAIREVLPPLVSPMGSKVIDLAAVCDLVEDRARETAVRFGAQAYYTDYKQMLAKADLDIVGIITPIPSHFPIALDAINAGKHTYVQKTMTVTVDEATRLIDAAKAQGVKLVASPGTHLSLSGTFCERVVDAIIQCLESGDVGKLAWGRVTVHMRHEHEMERGTEGVQSVDPSWYYKPGSGPLRDLAVYPMHALTWVLGPAKRVTAVSNILLPGREWKGKKIHVEMDDCTTHIVEFADDVQITFNTSFIKGSPVSPILELVGDKGVIVIGGRGAQGAVELWVQNEEQMTYGFGHDLKEVLPFDETKHLPGEHILTDILHLAECIQEDKTPIVSAEHARHVIEIIEKTYEAAHTGVTQHLTTSFERPKR